MTTPVSDGRPWLIFRSHRGIRVKKRNVLEMGQGRRGEELIGQLDGTLPSHVAAKIAREGYSRLSKPVVVVPKTSVMLWYGYYCPSTGARCLREPIDKLRPGETFVGKFPADMFEEDVIGMILSRYPKPTRRRGTR